MLSLCCGIGPGTRLSPESSLIHPNSPFYVFESVTIALFLMYTAVVTPVTVSFYWHQNPCVKMPTLEFDIFVDACFLADIVLTFFVGIYIEGRYVDDKAIVFSHYLWNGFLFDVCTSFPVSFMEASIIAHCEQGQSDLDISSSSLRMIRVMKPLRLIKLIRIIKVVKTLAIANAIGEMLRVPPRAVRLMKVLVGIALGVHTCSCIYWLCKTLSFSAEEVQQFLDELDIGSDVKSQYISSFYFITTIFTTIGFGDIVPLNLSERIFGIVVMYIGSITYGILLAEVQQLVAQASQDAIERDAFIQSLLDFMQEHDIPRKVENDVIRWSKFDFEKMQATRKQTRVLDVLPRALRHNILRFLHKDMLEKIPLFSEMMRFAGKDLMLDLCHSMSSMTYYPSSPICESDEVADRLFVVASGTAKVELSVHREGKRAVGAPSVRARLGVKCTAEQSDSDDMQVMADKDVIMLTIGDHFGEYSLLGETDWSANFPGLYVKISAVSALSCMVLTREKFQAVIASYPEEVKQEIESLSSDYLSSKQHAHRLERARVARVYFRWSKVFSRLTTGKQALDPQPLSLADRLARKIDDRGRGKRDAQAATRTTSSTQSPPGSHASSDESEPESWTSSISRQGGSSKGKAGRARRGVGGGGWQSAPNGPHVPNNVAPSDSQLKCHTSHDASGDYSLLSRKVITSLCIFEHGFARTTSMPGQSRTHAHAHEYQVDLLGLQMQRIESMLDQALSGSSAFVPRKRAQQLTRGDGHFGVAQVASAEAVSLGGCSRVGVLDSTAIAVTGRTTSFSSRHNGLDEVAATKRLASEPGKVETEIVFCNDRDADQPQD